METKQRKLYQNLTIDEPLPRDEAIEAEVAAMTPEQITAMVEAAWFMNPGGHFRMRILKMFERNGWLVETPDGHAMQFNPRLSAEQARSLEKIFELVEAVGGVLDDPFDETRTRADYVALTEDEILYWSAMNLTANWVKDQLDQGIDPPGKPPNPVILHPEDVLTEPQAKAVKAEFEAGRRQ